MRVRVPAAVCVAILLLGARAEAATQVWQGTAFVATVTGACTTANVAAVGDYYTLIYRPIIGTSQPGPEGLAFIGGRSALHWSTLSQTASFKNSATANTLALGSRATVSTGTGGYALTILPTAITANTASVTITGLLSNFWNVAGCNVTIRAALARR